MGARADDYHSLFDAVPIGLYRSTPDGRLLDANPALVHMLRYPDRATLLATPAAELYLNPDERARYLHRMQAEDVVVDFELQARCYDGSPIWVRARARTIRGPAGEILCYEGSAEDITARKQLEDELFRHHRSLEESVTVRTAELARLNLQLETELAERREVEQRLLAERDFSSRILEHSPAIMCSIAADGTTRFINAAGERLTGYTRAELVGRNWWRTFYPGNEHCQVERLFEAFRAGNVHGYEMALTTRAGEKRAISWSSINRHDADGTLTEVIGFGIDLTDRLQAEQLLRLQRDLCMSLGPITDLRRGLELVLDATCQVEGVDCGGVYVLNDATGDLELMCHRNVSVEFAAAAARLASDEAAHRLVMGGRPIYLHYSALPSTRAACEREGLRMLAAIPVLHEGQIIAALYMGSRSRDELPANARHALEAIAGRLGGTLARVRAEAARRLTEERFRVLSETAPVGIVLGDAVRGVVYANPCMERITGRSVANLMGDGWEACVHPDDVTALRQAVARTRDRDFELETDFRVCCPDGAVRWVHAHTATVSEQTAGLDLRVGVVQDITERVGAEEAARQHRDALAHATRVSTLGEMASGLAHELAQPLSAILYYARGCIARLQNGDWDAEDAIRALQKMAGQAERAGGFVRNLKAFVRNAEPQRVVADINAIVGEAVRLVAPEARARGVVVALDLQATVPSVVVDRIQIEQVCINLIRNAMDAASAKPRGARDVSVQTARTAARTVTVRVGDNGPGLPPNSNVFEPFFTTKPDGTGLGLPIARSIVEAHEGKLFIEVTGERGTTFAFTLPAAGEADHEAG